MKGLAYPPPYQDIGTLAAHLCVSENTVDNWVKLGQLPPPRRIGGKRLWSWAKVCKIMEAEDMATDDLARRITNATREATGKIDHG